MAELSLLTAEALPRWLERRRTVLAPGAALAYDPERWAGALVIVERGTVELECCSGERARLVCGAVLWLAGLALRALHNPGQEPVTLVTVARRAAAADYRAEARR